MMDERDRNYTQKNVDVAPDLKTRAIKLNVRNLLKALGNTPIGKDYPSPAIARVIGESLVQVPSGTHVTVHESDVAMVPGKRVIIYKQGKTSEQPKQTPFVK